MGRQYSTFNFLPVGKTFLTGIRGVKNSNKVYISGVYTPPNANDTRGLVYKGHLSGQGQWHVLNYPSFPGATVTGTSLYGPNNGSHKGTIQVVGNYNTQEAGQRALGCLYEGPLDGSGQWTTLLPTDEQPVINTIAHSTMGGLVVGNYDTQLATGKAFLYDIKTKEFFQIKHKDAVSITAYGIWHDCGHHYTIAGGFTQLDGLQTRSYAYIAHWNHKKKKLSHFMAYAYGNDPKTALITHFDGITGDGKGGYNLTGDWVGLDAQSTSEQAFFAHVRGLRGCATWKPIHYPGSKTTSGNSVYQKVIIGVYTTEQEGVINGYIAR
jgi:hypothetical protein